MRLHHLAFRTVDVPRAEQFYAGLLGLTVLDRKASGSVWLDAEGTILMLEPCDEGEPDVPEGSNELVCFSVEPARAKELAERLAGARVSIEARTAYTLYFRDPDGRRIGLSSFPAPLD